MLEVIILKGLPASGKSTWAKDFIQGKNNWVIVSRDSIRESTGEYWVPSREDYITDVEESSVLMALKNNLNVIIDATNLNDERNKKWDRIIDVVRYGKEINISYKSFDISIEEAIERDSKRERSVGKKVILNMARKYLPEEYKAYFTDKRILNPRKNDPNKQDCIICDLDGTLCLHNGRSPFDYSKVSTDIPNSDLISLLNILSIKYTILFVSGREGTFECRKDSMEWVSNNYGFPVDSSHFFFREEGDMRPDDIVKEEIYTNYIEPEYNAVAVFDDRNKVVDMWRKHNLLTCQVNYGEF